MSGWERRARLGSSKSDAAEAEGVGDDGDRADAHGGAGEHRVQQPAGERVENAGGEGEAEEVVGEGPEEVLLDVAEGGAGEVHGADEGGEVAFDEDEAGAVHGDIGAGAHGNADLGGGEGGGVVEAVAGEDHALATGLVDVDELLFRGGGGVGVETVEREFFRDGAGGGGAVAGDHNELETEAAEFGESGGGGGLDGVFEGEGADELAVGDDADDGGTGDGGGAVGVGGAADDDLAAADLGPDAEAGSGGEIGDGRKSEAAFAGGGDDGAGERVFAGGFGGGGAGGGGGAAGGIARGAGAV